MSDGRLRAAVLLLSALGAAIAAYLTVTHLTQSTVACLTGGCETVQSSRYAELAGVPVAALGLAGYVALALTAAFRGDLWRAAGVALALGGLGFAVYLIYVQVAVLDALCQWCLASDAVLALLVVATVARAWPADPPGAAPSHPAPRRTGRAPGRRAARRRPRR
jgi:uncharacterized membrane protein